MKSISEFINESISGEDLKDLKVCVNSVLERLFWGGEYQDYDTRAKVINALKKAQTNPDKSDLYERVVEILKLDYDFDMSDSEVLGSVSEFIKEYAQEELPNWKIVMKYTK